MSTIVLDEPISGNQYHDLVSQTMARSGAIEIDFELAFPRLWGSLRTHPVERKKAGLFIAPRRGLRRKWDFCMNTSSSRLQSKAAKSMRYAASHGWA